MHHMPRGDSNCSERVRMIISRRHMTYQKGWCSPGWDFFYGAMTKISIFPHCRLACECSLRNRMRRPQSDGNNTATTEPLLYCSYRGDLRPKFWLSTLKPKSSGLLASICRLDGDGEKCPNGLAIDPLGSGSAQVDWCCGSQALDTRQIRRFWTCQPCVSKRCREGGWQLRPHKN